MTDEPGGVKVFPLDPACEQYHRPTIAKGHLIELHRRIQQMQLDLDLAVDILHERNERVRAIKVVLRDFTDRHTALHGWSDERCALCSQSIDLLMAEKP